MAEVAQHRAAHARIGPDGAQRAPLQGGHTGHRAWRVARGKEQQQAAQGGERSHAQHQGGPGQGIAQGAQRVRTRRTQHQCPNQITQRRTQALAVPLRSDLHAHGVDARQEETRRKPPDHQSVEIANRPPCPHGAGGTGQGAHEKHPARCKPVCNGQQGKHKCAQDEAELQGGSERAHRTGRPAQFALEVGHDGIDREPQRGAQQLGEHQYREHVAGDLGLCHVSELTGLARVVVSPCSLAGGVAFRSQTSR